MTALQVVLHAYLHAESFCFYQLLRNQKGSPAKSTSQQSQHPHHTEINTYCCRELRARFLFYVRRLLEVRRAEHICPDMCRGPTVPQIRGCRHGHFGNPRIYGGFFFHGSRSLIQLPDNTYAGMNLTAGRPGLSVSFSPDIRKIFPLLGYTPCGTKTVLYPSCA